MTEARLEKAKVNHNNFKRLIQTDESGKAFLNDNFQDVNTFLADSLWLIRQVEELLPYKQAFEASKKAGSMSNKDLQKKISLDRPINKALLKGGYTTREVIENMYTTKEVIENIENINDIEKGLNK